MALRIELVMALARSAQWVRRVALPQVPYEFRASFLQRNPANRALLAATDPGGCLLRQR